MAPLCFKFLAPLIRCCDQSSRLCMQCAWQFMYEEGVVIILCDFYFSPPTPLFFIWSHPLCH